MGLSIQSSAESQGDAACAGEMQNQHLVHVFLESGTMKLIFKKKTQKTEQYFFPMTEKCLSIFIFLFTLAKFH